jgi:hypothetical protein
MHYQQISQKFKFQKSTETTKKKAPAASAGRPIDRCGGPPVYIPWNETSSVNYNVVWTELKYLFG